MQLKAPFWNIILLCTLLPVVSLTGIVPNVEMDDRQPGARAPEDMIIETPGDEDSLSRRQVRYKIPFNFWLLQCKRPILGANK